MAMEKHLIIAYVARSEEMENVTSTGSNDRNSFVFEDRIGYRSRSCQLLS
jgi:hypothetical protein